MIEDWLGASRQCAAAESGATPTKKPKVTMNAARSTRNDGTERPWTEETMIVKGRTRPLAICGHIQISDCVLRWARGTYLEERRLYAAQAEDVENETDDVDERYGR